MIVPLDAVVQSRKETMTKQSRERMISVADDSIETKALNMMKILSNESKEAMKNSPLQTIHDSSALKERGNDSPIKVLPAFNA